MKKIFALFSMLAIGSALVLSGCSDDSADNVGGAGGVANTGGSTSNTGGTTAEGGVGNTGGTTSATGGTTAEGGAGGDGGAGGSK